ncbi:hypothetical protein EB796_025132 [Bugula neritina]|uniref:Uncharacterized protein n=1 Tax=Bugula neritina TaxID=10212 RepID=A0A7J7IRI3_BUGNE|nr:hypothetical protein EB796_025132 [Bugula neritina]
MILCHLTQIQRVPTKSQEIVEQEDTYFIGEYVLVECKLPKKREQFYVGEIEQVEEPNIDCKFLKKKSEGLYFMFPEIPDRDIATKDSIVMKLSKPSQSKST